MLSIFKSDPGKKLRKSYNLKLEQAMIAQRNGDIRNYSLITAEAEEIFKEIQKLESGQK